MSASIRVAISADAGEIAELGNQLGYDLGTPEPRKILGGSSSRIVSASSLPRSTALSSDGSTRFSRNISSRKRSSSSAVWSSTRTTVVRGLPGMLMASAEEWARERGCFVVRLTSSSTRTAAHQFYERIGYEHIKTQYAFIKTLDVAGQHRVRRFVPKVGRMRNPASSE